MTREQAKQQLWDRGWSRGRMGLWIPPGRPGLSQYNQSGLTLAEAAVKEKLLSSLQEKWEDSPK